MTFSNGGVPPEKIKVLAEPSDPYFYDPALPISSIQLPRPINYDSAPEDSGDYFNFLSVMKWEERKGWKDLVSVFIRTFDPAKVFLYFCSIVPNEVVTLFLGKSKTDHSLIFEP